MGLIRYIRWRLYRLRYEVFPLPLNEGKYCVILHDRFTGKKHIVSEKLRSRREARDFMRAHYRPETYSGHYKLQGFSTLPPWTIRKRGILKKILTFASGFCLCSSPKV